MKLKKLICIVMVSVLGVLSFAGCAKKQDEKKTETSSEASTQEASAQVFFSLKKGTVFSDNSFFDVLF